MNEAVDLDADLAKLKLDLDEKTLRLVEKDKVLAVCTGALVDARKPSYKPLWGYAAGILGTGLLLTVPWAPLGPSERYAATVGGMLSLGVGYWLVAP